MLTIQELTDMGVKVTICPPRKAKGITKQKMRARLAGVFRVGGSRPSAVRGGTVEEALSAA